MSGGRERRGEETAEVRAEWADEDEALGEAVGAAGVAVPLAAAGGLDEAAPAGGGRPQRAGPADQYHPGAGPGEG